MAARQPPPSSASAPAPAAGLSMKDYLKRYVSGPGTNDDQKRAKKKTKKKPKPAGGVLIVDEDPVWQKPVQVDEEPASSGALPLLS
jgi:pre-mRNA-splicing factor CWC26